MSSSDVLLNEQNPEKAARASVPALFFQRWVGWLFCIPFYETIAFLLRSRRYQIVNLAEIRALYRELFETARKERTPLIICANHLTFIDSCLMIWAFGSSRWYFRNYRAFSWNLPAGDFFRSKFAFRVVAFFGKCIFIHRDGTREHKESVLETSRDLAARGEVVTIFPEGRRSRSGRFEADRMTYGLGKVVAALGDCRVLCVYVRGDTQDGFSSYPPKGARFSMQSRVLRPVLKETGKKAYFEVLQQVGQAIQAMENEHFRCLSR